MAAAGRQPRAADTHEENHQERKRDHRLAADGYFVYAGARKEKDLLELDAIENVDAVRLDVTSDADIAAAVETITRAGRGLYGLVNNAGVAIVGPLVETSEADLHYVMNVNVCGTYRVTKAFSPLITAANGRITTIRTAIQELVQLNEQQPFSYDRKALVEMLDAELALSQGTR